MKKIISQFSTNILLGCLMIFVANYQNHPTFDIKANAELEITASNSEESINSNEKVPSKPEDSVDPPTLPETPVDKFQFDTKLIIKAINPGYTIDGIRDVGEFIELQNVTSDNLISLAGYSLRYVNSSGKSTTLLDFSEGSTMVGEFLLFRLARTTNSEFSDATYTTTLAMSNGKLELYHDDRLIDQVCWSKDPECSAVFDSKKPTILVRDLDTGDFIHLESYETHFNAERPALNLPAIDEAPSPDDTSQNDKEESNTADSNPQPKCQGLEFSEILSYYVEDQNEQFIELYNPTDFTIELTGCSLRYKKKTYALSGQIMADGYYVFFPAKAEPVFTLTKNPSSSNTIELIDVNDAVVDALVYIHGQKKSTAYAKFYETDGSELWSLTYLPTPNSPNVYQEFRTCPEGKIINPLTGNCIKVSSSSTNTLAECPEGKYRNPLTGRCKNIESSSTEPKPCAEGYERNPETNRCRKIKTTNDGADYALVPATYSDQKTFTALGVVLAIICAGVTYIILQFRREIARALRKVRQRLHDVRKDLFTRCIGFHRNKKS